MIYTTPNQDWGYCMWECGVATLPTSPETRIILFQCGDSAPSLFDGQLGVNARNKISVQGFVTQFMTSPDFLPNACVPLTGFHKTDPQVQHAANKFFDDLKAVIPEGPVVEWPAHPYVQLQLSKKYTKTIVDAPTAERQAISRKIVLSDATVSDSDKYLQALFGKAGLDNGVTLQQLYETWKAVYPKRSEAWIDALVERIGPRSAVAVPCIEVGGHAGGG